MGRRQELVTLYANELVEKCRMEPDDVLLEKIAVGCGPAIYHPDEQFVFASRQGDLTGIKRNLLIRKLALEDGPELMAAIKSVLATYKAPESQRYRAVVYYMLVKHFGREQQYL